MNNPISVNTYRPKIMIIGYFRYHFYEEAVANSFEKMGCPIHRFKIGDHYRNKYLTKIEEHLSMPGIGHRSVFNNLKQSCLEFHPDWILIWRGVIFDGERINWLKSLVPTRIISFNNDDPFSRLYLTTNVHMKLLTNVHMKLLWRNFINAIPYYDVNLVFRPHNISEYESIGGINVRLFPPFYLPEQVITIEGKKELDVVFIGHYTSDRLSAINKLLDNGVSVKVYGTGWDETLLSDEYRYDGPIEALYDETYYQIISQSKIALAFLSKLNRDVYTRRSFEIPACGTVMVSERTSELESLYEDGEEAVFFSDEYELVSKVKNLLKDKTKISRIAFLGQIRAKESGYSVECRVDKLLKQLKKIDDNF
jgi:hypothetical protein